MAISQLEATTKLPGAIRAVGLPDLHAGKSPVGMALETVGIIYPHLIGGDIGCGMGLFDTSIVMGKYNEKRWVSKLNHIRELGDTETVNPYEEPSPIIDLGTIGCGNHFAEFQRVEQIFDSSSFSALNLSENSVALLVHSGSRGYGQEVFRETEFGIGFDEDNPEAADYLQRHDTALLWARRNRSLVAQKLIRYLGYDTKATPSSTCSTTIWKGVSILIPHVYRAFRSIHIRRLPA